MTNKKRIFLLLILIVGLSFFLIPDQKTDNQNIRNRYSNNLKTADQSVLLNFNTPEENNSIISVFYNYTVVITIIKPEPVFDYGVPNVTIYQNETNPIVDWTSMDQIGSSDSWNYTFDPINYINGNYTIKVRALDYIGFGYNQTEIYVLNEPPSITFINLSPLDKIHRINQPYFNVNVSAIDPENDTIIGVAVLIMDINDTIVLAWVGMENTHNDYYNYTFDPINYELGYYTIWIGVTDKKNQNYETLSIIIYEITPNINLLKPSETNLSVNKNYLISCVVLNDFDITSVEWGLTKELDAKEWNDLSYNGSSGYWEGDLNTIGYGIGDFYLVIKATDNLNLSFSIVIDITLIYQTFPSIYILSPNTTEFRLDDKYTIKCNISNDFNITSVKWAITTELGNYEWRDLSFNESSGYWEGIIYGVDYCIGDHYFVINSIDEFNISFSTTIPITFIEGSNENGSNNPFDYLLWLLFVLAIIIISVLGLLFIVKKKSSKKYITPFKVPIKKKEKTVAIDGSLLNTPERFKGFVDTINLLIKDGINANEEGNYKNAIRYWTISIKQLEKIKKKAHIIENSLPEFLNDIEDQTVFLNANIENAWNKEKSRIAHYFLDVTSIHAVIISHIERCSCLSKIFYHRGQEIDETLFSAFISAILSFKTEIGNKMGLNQKNNKMNTLSFNNFNITLLDGAFLRLGIVSDVLLNEFIIKKAYRFIDRYEHIHYEKLKYFDGKLSDYRDFPESIDNEFDLALNRKSRVNIDNFVKSRCPKEIKIILRKLLDDKTIFYPAKLWDIIMRDANLSKKDAIHHTYTLFQENVFSTIEDIPKSEDKFYPTIEQKNSF